MADAYGWEVGLEEDEVLLRLLELNGQRGAEKNRDDSPVAFRFAEKGAEPPLLTKVKKKCKATSKGTG